jgi:hypothetical protein
LGSRGNIRDYEREGVTNLRWERATIVIAVRNAVSKDEADLSGGLVGALEILAAMPSRKKVWIS